MNPTKMTHYVAIRAAFLQHKVDEVPQRWAEAKRTLNSENFSPFIDQRYACPECFSDVNYYLINKHEEVCTPTN